MPRHARRCGLFMAMVAAAGLLAGCTVRGGGWFKSSFDDKKVTFTLNATFDLSTGETSGQGQVKDRSLDVRAHLVGGPFSSAIYGPFSDLVVQCSTLLDVPEPTGLNNAYFFGTYRPQPANLGVGGEFAAYVVDGDGFGEPGVDDFVVIAFYGGVFDGYFNCGYMEGGNLTVTTPDP